jgi:hypothetical protein
MKHTGMLRRPPTKQFLGHHESGFERFSYPRLGRLEGRQRGLATGHTRAGLTRTRIYANAA